MEIEDKTTELTQDEKKVQYAGNEFKKFLEKNLNHKDFNPEVFLTGEECYKTSEIIFNVEDAWVMKLTREGIFFNRDRYPNDTPDDFADAVIKILEKQYKVRFEKNILP